MVRLLRAAADAQTPTLLLRWWYATFSIHAMTMALLTMPCIYMCPANAPNLYIHASWDIWGMLNIAFAVCILHPMTYLPTHRKPLSTKPA